MRVYIFGGILTEQSTAKRSFIEAFLMLACVPAEKLEYLGSHLLKESFVAVFDKTCTKAVNLINRIDILPAHQALFIIKNCLGPICPVYRVRLSRAYFLVTYSELLTKRCGFV